MGAAWRIARKDLTLRLRDRSAFILGIGVPLVLAFIFNFIFGGAFSGESIAVIGIANEDGGEVSQGVEDILGFLADDGVIEVVTAPDEAALEEMIEGDEIGAGISVPNGLSEAVLAGQAAEVEVIGQPDSPTAEAVARGIADSFAAGVADTQRGVAALTAIQGGLDPAVIPELGQALAAAPPVASIGEVAAADRVLDPTTFFAASMAVFFVFFMVQFGVTGLLDEEREGTLTRLQIAPIPRWAVVVGKTITSILLGVASLTVLWLATTFLMGADWGPPAGVLVLIVAVVLAATSIIGVVAGLTRTPEAAGNVGSIIAVALGMLGGTFFPVGSNNRLLELLTSATPHAWFLRGLGALKAGEGLGGLVPAVGALLAFGVVMGVAAAVLLRRRYA